MAFLNKIGNVLKHGVGKSTHLELSVSNASLFQAIRSMSSSKLFVGGLSYGTDESSLKEAFSQYGEVIEARVILDRDTGRSRGFGFISFSSSEEATSAMHAMDGQDLHGRWIKVNYAAEKRRDGFGGGYGGGGGYNYGGEGGNFSGGGGYAAGNYGGGGGGFSGGYGSAGGGGYGSSSGYNYDGEGRNFAGAGGYQTNNYGGGGGGFSSGNGSAGGYGSYGGGSNYGNNNSSPVQSGNYGSTSNNNYSGQGSSFSGGYDSGNSNGFANTGFSGSSEASYNGGQEQLTADQGTQSINEDIGKETSEGNYMDDKDEPKDYANTRG